MNNMVCQVWTRALVVAMDDEYGVWGWMTNFFVGMPRMVLGYGILK